MWLRKYGGNYFYVKFGKAEKTSATFTSLHKSRRFLRQNGQGEKRCTFFFFTFYADSKIERLLVALTGGLKTIGSMRKLLGFWPQIR